MMFEGMNITSDTLPLLLASLKARNKTSLHERHFTLKKYLCQFVLWFLPAASAATNFWSGYDVPQQSLDSSQGNTNVLDEDPMSFFIENKANVHQQAMPLIVLTVGVLLACAVL